MGRLTRSPEPFKASGQAAPLKTTRRRAALWKLAEGTTDYPLTAESWRRVRDKPTPIRRLPEKPTTGSRPAASTDAHALGTGSGYSEAHSLPFPKAGVA